MKNRLPKHADAEHAFLPVYDSCLPACGKEETEEESNRKTLTVKAFCSYYITKVKILKELFCKTIEKQAGFMYNVQKARVKTAAVPRRI